MTKHKVVSQKEWIAARKALLVKEKKFTRSRDQLSQERRQLPWVKVDKEYVFDGPKGKETLAELFDGRSQLIVYHFMFAPDWDAGCKHCSFWADNFNQIVVHLNHRDVTMLAVSRALYSKLAAYQKRMAGISSGSQPATQSSISTTMCHLRRPRWPRKKRSTTTQDKTHTVQIGRELASFTRTQRVACFIPIQLTRVASTW